MPDLVKDETNLKKGNRMLKEQRYQEAIVFYEKAVNDLPSLKRMIALNIRYAESRLKKDKDNNDDSFLLSKIPGEEELPAIEASSSAPKLDEKKQQSTLCICVIGSKIHSQTNQSLVCYLKSQTQIIANVKLTYLIDSGAPDNIERSLRERDIEFSDMFFKAYDAPDSYWINIVMMYVEADAYLFIYDEQKDSLPAAFELLDKQKTCQSLIDFVLVNDDSIVRENREEKIAALYVSSRATREYIGYFLPIKTSLFLANYILRLSEHNVSECIKGDLDRLLDNIRVAFSGNWSKLLSVIEAITEKNLKLKNEKYLPVNYLPIYYQTLPPVLISETLLAIYCGSSETGAHLFKGNIYVFDSKLKRYGYTNRVKATNILAPVAGNYNLVTLTNRRNNSLNHTCCWSIYEKELKFIDLFYPFPFAELDLQKAQKEGKLLVQIAIPVIKKQRLSNPSSVRKTLELNQKVSLVCANFNTVGTIINSLDSLVSQSLENIELVLVDDNSEDSSPKLATHFLEEFKYLEKKIIVKNSNDGPYVCRNIGILESTGPLIAGSDLDDINTPQRLFIASVLLTDRSRRIALSKHARIDQQGNVLGFKKNKNLSSVCYRDGFITWVAQREIFSQVGLFLPRRSAADSEFISRLEAKVNKKLIMKYSDVSYFALLDYSKGGLTRDIFFRKEEFPGLYFFRQSKERQQFEKEYLDKHASGPDEQKKVIFALNEEQLATTVIVANMATIPSREDRLILSLESILPQVDRLNLFLNNFQGLPKKLDTVLKKWSNKLVIYKSQDVGDLRDNAKFYFLDSVSPSTYYFTLDDDILYPVDYINRMLYKSSIYNDRAVLCVHGYRLWENVNSVHKDSAKRGRYHHFADKLEFDIHVDIGGTGTVLIPPLAKVTSINEPPYGIADIVFAKRLREAGVEIVCIARQANWLKSLPHPQRSGHGTLYKENQQIEREQLIQSLLPQAKDRVNRKIAKSASNDERVISSCSAAADSHFNCFDKPVLVLCTGFNNADYVEDFIVSLWTALKATNYNDISIFFYDDASTDDSATIVVDKTKELLTHWPVQVYRSKVNYGPGFARPFLIESCQDKEGICVFLDSDDYVFPDIFREIISAYSTDSNTKGTFGSWRFRDKIKPAWPILTDDEIELDLIKLMESFRFGPPRTFLKSLFDRAHKDLLLTPDGEWLKFCSDLGLMLSVLIECPPSNFKRISKVLYEYNVGTQNSTIALYGQDKSVVRAWLYSFAKSIYCNRAELNGALLSDQYAQRFATDKDNVELLLAQ
jgi:glycosyltransferase involved in cell wall biosynthesis